MLKECPLRPLSDISDADSTKNNRTKEETEPNCTLVVDKLNTSIDDDVTECKCNSTNRCSSLDLKECTCTCPSMSIINQTNENSKEYASIKERHMSIDSARDSGIGDNSNFTDLETKYDEEDSKNETTENKKVLNVYESASSSDLRGLWQPKVKKSLADRLAENSFHLVPPSRYIFPGAEVFYDPDESFHCQDDEEEEDGDGSSLDSSESDSELNV